MKCSKCGAVMVERVNRTTLLKFMGCSNFPKRKGSPKKRDKPPQRWYSSEGPWDFMDYDLFDGGF